MEKNVERILVSALESYPCLESVKSDIVKAYECLRYSFEGGNKLLVCGNGGSCSDSLHIVGELMKDFCIKRPIKAEVCDRLKALGDEGKALCTLLSGALPTVSLCTESALGSAVINDVSAKVVFAQQVYGLGNKGDVLLTLSTSGNSGNCRLAALTARAKEMTTIAMTGEQGGALAKLCDITIKVPQKATFKVQELHLPVYHTLCLMLEEHFFGQRTEE